EPEEQGRGEECEATAAPDEVAERALDESEGVGLAFTRVGKEALQQLVDVELVNGDLVLDEIPDDREHEADEGNRGEEDVERDGAGEKGDVVFVGRFEGPPDDTGDHAVPAAFTLRSPFPTRRRVPSPPSGANRNPATAPSAMPNRNAPNPLLPRSLIRPPPRHPAPRRARPVGPHATRASASRTDRWRRASPS